MFLVIKFHKWKFKGTVRVILSAAHHSLKWQCPIHSETFDQKCERHNRFSSFKSL